MVYIKVNLWLTCAMTDTTPIEKAIQILGGQEKLAEKLRVSKQAVTKWRKKVPAERVLGIESATGGEVTRHELRPDLYPVEPTTA